MGADTATETGWNTTTIGPYIAAAAAMLGPPADGAIDGRVQEVIALGRRLALATAQSIPVRSVVVTGALSVAATQNNAHRTQIAIDTGQSKFGADEMWTDYESEAAAKNTRAALLRHAGKRVRATKVTLLEFYPDGRPVPGEKGGQQTRTRLEPGSLLLLGDNDEVVGPIDLSAPAQQTAQPRQAGAPRRGRAAGVPAAMVDAATSYQRLVERLGADAAAAAWGDLPRIGQIPRARLEQLAAEHGLADNQPAAQTAA